MTSAGREVEHRASGVGVVVVLGEGEAHRAIAMCAIVREAEKSSAPDLIAS